MANTTTTKTFAWPPGVNILRAGTPLDTDGKVANDATAVGIVAADLCAPDKTATVITAGEWDESVNAPYFRISDAAKEAMPDIEFTTPPASAALEVYVKKTDLATTEAAGIVKQAAAVADAEDAPTMAEYNGLLGALRDRHARGRRRI